MNAFKKVIGYETIKNELMQICDMMHNKERYEALGAKLPSGVLMDGSPGVGKTLIANCFIEESGVKCYTVRKNKSNGNFVEEITKAFDEAKANAPSIVFLDDMDKFANEDDRHRDAEEYVAVQAGIDSIKNDDVFVIATTNALDKLPQSLIRSGRFDRTITLSMPSKTDATKIIEYYLSNKKISDDVNFDDLCKMMSYHSCAELETIINEAAIRAGYAMKECIEMQDLINAVLRLQYNSPDDCLEKEKDELKRVAIHEAGHLVINEVISPGSVGLASIRTTGRGNLAGFIHKCDEPKRRPHIIMGLLGGKVATELYYADHIAAGCHSDLHKAIRVIRIGIAESGTNGIEFLEYSTRDFSLPDSTYERREIVVHAELERYILQTKNALLQNREFLEKVANALLEKETLLYSDIQAIRKSVNVQEVA